MTVPPIKDLVDDLVTLCLGTRLESAQARLQGETLLEALIEHEAVKSKNLLHAKVLELRAKLTELRVEAPSRVVSESLVEAVERLSHELYTLVAGQPEVGAAEQTSGSLELPSEVDAQLFGEFLSNACLTLQDLEREIETLRQGDLEAAAAVRRRIHTFKGESGMVGLMDLEHVLHCAETYLEKQTPPWDRADRLLAVHDWVTDALAAYADLKHPVVASEKIVALLAADLAVDCDPLKSSDSRISGELPPELPSEAVAIPHSAGSCASSTPVAETGCEGVRVCEQVTGRDPAPAAGAGVATASNDETRPWPAEDDDLVVEFLHEVDEHLASVDQVLLDSEQSGMDSERINRLFRAFHTLKGVASFLHLNQFQELTHTTETMLARIRSGQPIPPRAAIDLVFDSTTVLRELARFIQAALGNHSNLETHPGVPELLTRIREAIESNSGESEHPVQPAGPGEKLGEILVREGVVAPETIVSVLEVQKATGNKLGEELIAKAAVPAQAVAHALRAQQLSNEVNSKLKEVVKVDLERVDNLVEAIGELVIVESMVSNAPEIRQLPAHLRNYLGQFAKITRELQELGMCMRMVPVRAEFQKMMRIVRDLARRSNKRVRMDLAGEGTEMDRIMVEQIADPLVHLIRNAVDHGIEPAEERRALGKPEMGTVRLSACHEGGSIVIEISDDGRGINRERVLAKAVSLGLVDRSATLTDGQVFELIFAPGFSTAEQVTEISGRGVGMDVVKRNIEAVRGRIITNSVPGRGTSFRLVLPLTLAIIDGMVIRCGDERFILPTLNIVESLQPTVDMLFSIAGVREQILVRGQSLPLIRLDRVLGVSGGESDPTKALVIIVESLNTQVALLVDEVVMKQQVVIKTLSSELDASRIFSGAAILSNGRVGLIINVESLIDLSRDFSLPTEVLTGGARASVATLH